MADLSLLEKKWGIKRSKYDYMSLQEDKLPRELLVLVPYISFFCVEDQSFREDFLNSLPQSCFAELYKALSSIQKDFLRDWLAEDENYEYNKINWRVLAVLNEIPGNYLD